MGTRMNRATQLTPVGLLALVVLSAWPGVSALAASPVRGDPALKPWSIQLCAPAGVSPAELTHAGRITRQRLTSFSISASVALNRTTGCEVVQVSAPIIWFSRLAKVLRERGTFALGVFLPYDGRHLYAPSGMPVRYTTDPITSRNKDEYTVQVLFGREDFVPSSFALTGPPNAQVLHYRLRPTASKAWCKFTTAHTNLLDTRLIDRRIVIVAHIETPICNASGQITFDGPIPRHGPWSPPAFASYLRFGALPFNWSSVSISEQQITD